MSKGTARVLLNILPDQARHSNRRPCLTMFLASRRSLRTNQAGNMLSGFFASLSIFLCEMARVGAATPAREALEVN